MYQLNPEEYMSKRKSVIHDDGFHGREEHYFKKAGVRMSEKIVQTAGRDQLGAFAPEFAHFNDDILFGENWNNTDIDLTFIHKTCKHNGYRCPV